MRREPVLALILAAVLVLTGCQTPTSGSAPTTGAATGELRPTGDLAELTGDISTAVARAGSVSFAMDGTAEDGTVRAKGVARITGATAETSMTLDMGAEGELAVIILDTTTYLRIPGKGNPIGKPWISISGPGNDPVSKLFGAMIDKAKSPTQLERVIQLLRDTGEINDSGPDRVNEVNTTRYTVSVDLAKAVDTAPDEATRTTHRKLADSGMTTVDYVLWVDANQLPVKIATTRMFPERSGKDTKVDLTMTYSDWGEPTTITAPPPAEVGDLNSLDRPDK